MSTLMNKAPLALSSFIVFIYASYGEFIISLFITTGDKGSFRSPDFLFAVIVTLLMFFTDFGKQLFNRILAAGEMLPLMLFMFYFFIRLIFEPLDVQQYFVWIFSTKICPFFIAGFIASSSLSTKISGLRKMIEKANDMSSFKNLAIAGTAIFVILVIYFFYRISGMSLLEISDFSYLANDYYQEFGDYASIAYFSLISLQITYFRLLPYSYRRFTKLVLIVGLQAILAFFTLQAATSNKSVPLIFLVSGSAIYYCKPKNWLWKRGRPTIDALFVPCLLFLLVVATLHFGSGMDTSKLRIFDYGQESSLFMNSSITSRLELIQRVGLDLIWDSPLFGTMITNDPMHSSVMSVQVQFGIFGTLLFWPYILINLRRTYGSEGDATVKSLAIPILFVSIISSWFAWGPLWYLIGRFSGQGKLRAPSREPHYGYPYYRRPQ